jgi:hypothetical protein
MFQNEVLDLKTNFRHRIQNTKICYVTIDTNAYLVHLHTKFAFQENHKHFRFSCAAKNSNDFCYVSKVFYFSPLLRFSPFIYTV